MAKPTSPDDGDCLMAATASILEVELDDLPALAPGQEHDWFEHLEAAVRSRGYRAFALEAGAPPIIPPGYAIAIGPSPLGEGDHAVVALDGHVVHDPHPEKSGVRSIAYYVLLLPIARTAPRLTPTDHADVGAVL